MTQADLYDFLLAAGILEPACVMFGTRCVVGRWADVSEARPADIGYARPEGPAGRVSPSGDPTIYIMRVGRVGVIVLGEGDTWDAAHEAAMAKLA